ncbi:MAG: molybdopterin molybdenumtransferase MoeA, partial [Dokdonella sp.]
MTAPDDTMISVSDAQARFVALCLARELATELVSLASADGRVIASDVHAPISIPPFANSAMDGFALRGADLPTHSERSFRLVATRLAGTAEEIFIDEGECVRITTGAAIPHGCDSVVIRERVQVDGDYVRVRA